MTSQSAPRAALCLAACLFAATSAVADERSMPTGPFEGRDASHVARALAPPGALPTDGTRGDEWIELVGGEDCATAVPLPGPLPVSVTGSTIDFVSDYDETCPFAGAGAPDVVYTFTAPADMALDLTLCAGATDYDTKLYIYDACPPTSGSLVACNDDDCESTIGQGFVSRILGVPLTGGATYYIVVDGFGSESGTYYLRVNEAAPPPDCPPEAEFSQRPVRPDEGDDYGASSGSTTRLESFSGLSGPVCAVRWWGLSQEFTGSWVDCDPPDPAEFEITFYADSGGEPGPVVWSQVVTADVVDTGTFVGGSPLYEYSATLAPCCDIMAGWVSVYGLDPSCFLMWVSSPEGDGSSYRDTGFFTLPEAFDLCLCLSSGSAAGACCFAGNCAQLTEGDCQVENGLWGGVGSACPVETVAPTFVSAPGDLTLTCDPETNPADITQWLSSAAATDASGWVDLTHDYAGLPSACGSVVVTWTATDACGNTAVHTAALTIEDDQPPTLLQPAGTLSVPCVGWEPVLDDFLASHGGAVASDACGPVVWTHDFAELEPACGGAGFADVTFTAIDACGNTTTTTGTFSVVDGVPPVFTFVPPHRRIVLPTGDEITLAFSAAEAEDACGGGVEISATRSDGLPLSAPFPVGVTTVTWTAADECGNVRFAEQRVTFELRPGVEPIDKSGPPRSQATPLPGSGPDEPVGGLPTGQK